MAILTRYLTTVRGSEEGAMRIGYVVQFYHRMSKDRLEEIRELYHTNAKDRNR